MHAYVHTNILNIHMYIHTHTYIHAYIQYNTVDYKQNKTNVTHMNTYITQHYTTLHYATLHYLTLHTYKHTYMPYTHAHKYIYIVYIHAYKHTYTPTYIHTYIHTYIPTCYMAQASGFKRLRWPKRRGLDTTRPPRPGLCQGVRASWTRSYQCCRSPTCSNWIWEDRVCEGYVCCKCGLTWKQPSQGYFSRSSPTRSPRKLNLRRSL